MDNRDCFGILDNVFPVSEKGLREIVPECFQCPDRTLCLREAMHSKEGIKMREEILDRAAERGLVSRLQRWSRKKELDRLAEQHKKKKRRWWK